MKWDEINCQWTRNFYEKIINMESCPTLKIVLDSILEEGSNIAIYGAGGVGKNVYNIIRSHGKHNIVLWCDKNADNIGNKLVSKPEKLLSCSYEAVVIAIGNKKIVEEVKEYLLLQGVLENKIFFV